MNKKKIKIQVTDHYEKLFAKTIKNRLEEDYDLEFSERPDFLFYSVYGNGRGHYCYKNCVKIFWAVEGVIPDFNECDYAIGSYPMDIGDRYLQIPYVPMPKAIQDRKRFQNIDIENQKFCNFIYSNSSVGSGAFLRQEFCKKLMHYKNVDCPGNVLNNMKDAIEPREGRWYQGKIDFIKNYKFTIAFENAAMPGMISEKLLQAFEAGSIPIYWGAPDVNTLFDEKSFINCNNYKSWDEVIDRIIELDTNKEKYMNMLLTTPALRNYDDMTNERISQFLCNIVEKGNIPFEKDPLGRDAGTIAGTQLGESHNNLFLNLYCKQKKIENLVKKGKKKIFKK